MKKTFVLGVAVAIGYASAVFCAPPTIPKSAAHKPTSELQIDSGAIRGLVLGDKKDVHAYKGIPYAAPPVGEQRWKAPQPAAAWKRVRDCFNFGAACPQKVPASLPASRRWRSTRLSARTACSSTSGLRPSTNPKNFPFSTGFMAAASSWGPPLSRCTTAKHSPGWAVSWSRSTIAWACSVSCASGAQPGIGSQGFGQLRLARPDRRASLGQTQYRGLRRRPRARHDFRRIGGRHQRLVSDGSAEAKGLFQGAVAQSSTGMNLAQLREASAGRESAEQAGQKLITACGLAASADLKKMRSLNAKALLEAAPFAPTSPGALHLKPLSLRLGPIVDQHLIPDSPNALFTAGREHAVPLIIGNTKDEMSLFLTASPMPADRNAYLAKLKEEFGDLAEPLARAYPAENSKEIRAAIIQLTTDLNFASESRFAARAHTAAGQKAFRYQFSRGTKQGFLQSLGAHHGAELGYLFQHVATRNDEREKRIAHDIGRYWINFAATGNPNGAHVPEWPAYRTDAEEVVDFGDKITVLKAPRTDQLDLIDKVLQATTNSDTRKTQR